MACGAQHDAAEPHVPADCGRQVPGAQPPLAGGLRPHLAPHHCRHQQQARVTPHPSLYPTGSPGTPRRCCVPLLLNARPWMAGPGSGSRAGTGLVAGTTPTEPSRVPGRVLLGAALLAKTLNLNPGAAGAGSPWRRRCVTRGCAGGWPPRWCTPTRSSSRCPTRCAPQSSRRGDLSVSRV